MKRIVQVLGVLILAAACALAGRQLVAQQRQRDQTRTWVALQQTAQFRHLAKDFDKHKATAAAIFAGATLVESFRLFPDGSEKPLGKIGPVSYYAKGPELRPAFAARLGGLVLDPKSYILPGRETRPCYIDPGVGFRVWKDRQYLDVILCFHCNQLAVLENDPRVPDDFVGGWLEGRIYVTGEFDPARAKLLAQVKEAMPNDSAIQRI